MTFIYKRLLFFDMGSQDSVSNIFPGALSRHNLLSDSEKQNSVISLICLRGPYYRSLI